MLDFEILALCSNFAFNGILWEDDHRCWAFLLMRRILLIRETIFGEPN